MSNLGASPRLECWNSGILESWILASGSQSLRGLRLGEENGMVDLENQNEYNCIDFLVIVVYFLGQK
jgi:hypothetical protein